MRFIKLFVLTTSLLLSSLSLAQSTKQEISDRISPVGKVYLASDVEQAKNTQPAEPRDGTTVYTTTCSACHGTGLLGSPKFGSSEDWAPRVAQGKATLLKHALSGLNQMPAKGGCATCSDGEIEAALEHMLSAL